MPRQGGRPWRADLGRRAPRRGRARVARVLAAAVGRESPDLVLCGVQSSDAVNGATGIALAGHLDLPHVAVVKRGLRRDGSTLTRRARARGRPGRAAAVSLPALLTIQTGINEPQLCDAAGDQAGAREAARGPVARRPRARPGRGRGGGGIATAAAEHPDRGEGAEMLDGSAAEVAARIAEIVRGTDRLMAGRPGGRRGAPRRAAGGVAGADRRRGRGQAARRRAASRSR